MGDLKPLEEEDTLVSRSKKATHSNISYKNDTGTNLLIYFTSLKTSKMFNTVEKLMRLLKSETYFPRPVGQWEVGYIDIMAEGEPEDSSFIRLYYPTMQKHEFLPERCPIWTEHDTKHGFINFMHAMLKRWPSWVNDSEFIIKGIMDPIESLCSWAFKPLFAMGWEVLAKNPRIPVIHQAQLAKGHKFPLVIFSHGMGCNRYAYSKVCYDLCSEGFFVAAVEHREGSACHSRFNVSGKFIEIPHMYLADEDHEYEQRNKQVHQRAKEVTLAMDLVSSLNMGTTPNNVLNQEYGYDLANFVGRIDPVSHRCGSSFSTNCTSRPQLQEPKPIGRCPRLNGKWAVPETCDRYLECIDGYEKETNCQNHLIFDEKTGDCEHPDVAERAGCTAEELYGFHCPTGVPHGRYQAESDCRAFFSCDVTTKFHPRLNGCPQDTVFNPEKKICDEPKNVKGCEDYYKSEEL